MAVFTFFTFLPLLLLLVLVLLLVLPSRSRTLPTSQWLPQRSIPHSRRSSNSTATKRMAIAHASIVSRPSCNNISADYINPNSIAVLQIRHQQQQQQQQRQSIGRWCIWTTQLPRCIRQFSCSRCISCLRNVSLAILVCCSPIHHPCQLSRRRRRRRRW
jgi:hypothetical protein